RRHTRFSRDWSSDVCSSDLTCVGILVGFDHIQVMVADVSHAILFDESVEVEADFSPGHAAELVRGLVAKAYDTAGFSRGSLLGRSEERRVGKGCGSGGAP